MKNKMIFTRILIFILFSIFAFAITNINNTNINVTTGFISELTRSAMLAKFNRIRIITPLNKIKIVAKYRQTVEAFKHIAQSYHASANVNCAKKCLEDNKTELLWFPFGDTKPNSSYLTGNKFLQENKYLLLYINHGEDANSFHNPRITIDSKVFYYYNYDESISPCVWKH